MSLSSIILYRLHCRHCQAVKAEQRYHPEHTMTFHTCLEVTCHSRCQSSHTNTFFSSMHDASRHGVSSYLELASENEKNVGKLHVMSRQTTINWGKSSSEKNYKKVSIL